MSPIVLDKTAARLPIDRFRSQTEPACARPICTTVAAVPWKTFWPDAVSSVIVKAVQSVEVSLPRVRVVVGTCCAWLETGMPQMVTAAPIIPAIATHAGDLFFISDLTPIGTKM
jgi:hypothetical protein